MFKIEDTNTLYRISEWWIFTRSDPRTMCEFLWRFLSGLTVMTLLAHFPVGMFLTAWAFIGGFSISEMPNVYLKHLMVFGGILPWVIIVTVVTISGMVFLMNYISDNVFPKIKRWIFEYKTHRMIEKCDKQPSMIAEMYRGFKDKYCATVEIVSTHKDD